MRKNAPRRTSSGKSTAGRALQLSKETIKMLSGDELTRAVGGASCPPFSSETETQRQVPTVGI